MIRAKWLCLNIELVEAHPVASTQDIDQAIDILTADLINLYRFANQYPTQRHIGIGDQLRRGEEI